MVGREVEVDAISDGNDVCIPGIMEQIERSGVHSGDSIAVYPPQHLSQEIIETLTDYTRRDLLQVRGHEHLRQPQAQLGHSPGLLCEETGPQGCDHRDRGRAVGNCTQYGLLIVRS